jgi:S-adenosylmethionine/arginine decarboxylase-like enzyme
MEKEKYWGWELIINCAACDKQSITSEENIRNFIKDLVKRIDMEAYGDPMIAHFATHDPEKAGYSFCQMISTSAITAHMVDKNGDIYLNIFSCKPFSETTTLQVVKDYFNPTKISSIMINRKSPEI